MSQDRRRVAVEGDREDRISALPICVIDLILARLPAQCAARTCILSKNWRYNWAMHPNLLLDEQFIKHLAKRSLSYLKQTVDGILSRHRGPMVKFVLSTLKPVLPSYANIDIDRWMDIVTRNGVKELKLFMPFDIRYKLPPCVFNCPTITDLELRQCVIKPPVSFLGFPNLKLLQMTYVAIEPTTENVVINLPRLVNLKLLHCDGTQYLNIVSPKLESLSVGHCHYLVLNSFIDSNNLRVLQIRSDKSFDFVEPHVLEPVERSTLQKFFFRVAHTVEELNLDPVLLDLCCADVVPMMLPFSLNCLVDLSVSVGFRDLSQTSGVLQLIKSAPNLSVLKIAAFDAIKNVKAVSQYLKTADCLNRPLNKLKEVIIFWPMLSENALLFTKLLLSHTPSLERMYVLGRNMNMIGFQEELLCFPRASPKAELII